MSHFAKIKFKGTLPLIEQTLAAMGLRWVVHEEAAPLRVNPAWRDGQNITHAHIIVDPQSLQERGNDGRHISMDVGFVLNPDGQTYSPVLDEYVLRGNNANFSQQFVAKYSEFALEEKGFEIVRDASGQPMYERMDNGSVRMSLKPKQQQLARR